MGSRQPPTAHLDPVGALIRFPDTPSDTRTRSDPKDITEEEYLDFYRSTFKDYRKPIDWHHFSGDAAGTSFKGIIFLPEKMSVLLALCLGNSH